ncbi:site-2 protease family protein [bacterium BMS3Abin03]|nr:site-2 protease family protein [bacterium BMS3Abin03]MCG6959607.1 site-2 protease family protein [bacterium BMS3Abin03]
MGDIQISERLLNFIAFLPLFYLSIAVHEFAHALLANKYGDDTAKKLGRLTLNPLKHIDLIGSVIMPIAAFASGFALIGWAKPVPVDRRNFKEPLKADTVVSFAGPLSNFIFAILFFILFIISQQWFGAQHTFVVNLMWYGVFLNIFLFVFNLLPIPPLDGSHILFDLFPNKFTAKYLSLGFYGSFILLVFIYSPLWGFFIRIINFILRLFLKIGGYE